MAGRNEKAAPRRIAVSRVHFPDGSLRFNQVLEFVGDRPVRCYPLTEELPFTEWRGGDYYVRESDDVIS